MRRIGLVVLVSAIATANLGADEPTLHYSRLHYWAPTWIRVHAHMHPQSVPLYAADRFPGVPSPTAMVVYPRQPVSPVDYYQGTGLSYDPALNRPAPMGTPVVGKTPANRP